MLCGPGSQWLPESRRHLSPAQLLGAGRDVPSPRGQEGSFCGDAGATEERQAGLLPEGGHWCSFVGQTSFARGVSLPERSGPEPRGLALWRHRPFSQTAREDIQCPLAGRQYPGTETKPRGESFPQCQLGTNPG